MNLPDRIEHNPAIVPPLQPVGPQKAAQPGRTPDGKTFADVLRTKVGEQIAPHVGDEAKPAELAVTVKWSAHAAARLKQRGIDLGDAQLKRLESAVDKAAAKGSRDSLVMLDDIHMVVSVKNRTVITALGKDQAKDNVFTNIDSAVVA